MSVSAVSSRPSRVVMLVVWAETVVSSVATEPVRVVMALVLVEMFAALVAMRASGTAAQVEPLYR